MWGISWLAAEPVSFSRRTLLHGVSKYKISLHLTPDAGNQRYVIVAADSVIKWHTEFPFSCDSGPVFKSPAYKSSVSSIFKSTDPLRNFWWIFTVYGLNEIQFALYVDH